MFNDIFSIDEITTWFCTIVISVNFSEALLLYFLGWLFLKQSIFRFPCLFPNVNNLNGLYFSTKYFCTTPTSLSQRSPPTPYSISLNSDQNLKHTFISLHRSCLICWVSPVLCSLLMSLASASLMSHYNWCYSIWSFLNLPNISWTKT